MTELIALSPRQPPKTIRWSVSCGVNTYAALVDIPYDRLFRDVDAVVEAYQVGRPRAEAIFGPDVSYAGPNFGHISYGHINCLGAPLHYAEGGEVGFLPFCDNLADAMKAARRPVNWETAGEMSFFLHLWDQVRRRFPEHTITFDSFRSQGPFTTAWALRREGFFLDLYDDPEGCRQYLDAIVDSIIDFRRFIERVNHIPPDRDIGVTDDIAALLNPVQWEQFVVPVMERFFSGLEARYRWVHIENLTRPRLHFLDDLKVDFFNPSVSQHINAADVRDNCHCEFDWLLNPMQVRDYSTDQTISYIQMAARDGASALACHIEPITLDDHAISNIRTFIETAKTIGQSDGLDGLDEHHRLLRD